MKNIEEAIKAEKNYILQKVLGQHPDIHDFIDKFGYSDLGEFHEDKKDYILRNTEWVINKMDSGFEVDTYMYPAIASKTPAFIWMIDSNESLLISPRNEPDNEYGLSLLVLPYISGNGRICSFSGDLRIIMIMPKTIDIKIGYFLNKACSVLSENGVECSIDNNDIIYDGKKICGCAEGEMNKMKLYFFQFTFTDNTAIIEQVCGVNEKRPGYIPSEKITAEQLKNNFISWLQ